MNILFITVAYPKEGNSNLYSDLAEEFVRQGHKITVLSTDCLDTKTCVLKELSNGVEHLSVPVSNQFGVNIIKKGFINMRIPSLIKTAIKSHLWERKYEVIIYATPPVTISSTIAFAKKKYRARTYLMLKDIFPQNAVDLSMFKKNSVLYKFFRAKEKKLYDLSDNIGCMSKANTDFIENSFPGMYTNKLEIFPNTRKILPVSDSINIKDIRSKYQIPLDKKVFVLGGNLGKPQGLDFLLQGIEAAKEILNIHFLIVGNGSDAYKVENQANKSDNLTYIKHLPSEEYQVLMKSCDVGMISLNHNFTIPNIPSRLLAYMHESIPVFAITDTNTDLKDIIVDHAKCGWWCESNDVESFVNKVKLIDNEYKFYNTYGSNGRDYMIEYYNVEDSINKIIEI